MAVALALAVTLALTVTLSSEVFTKHKERVRPPEGIGYAFTWTNEGGLGLRLVRGPEVGVTVGYISPDADAELADITGWTISAVDEDDVLNDNGKVSP